MKKSFILKLKTTDNLYLTKIINSIQKEKEITYRFFDTFDNKIRNNNNYLLYFDENLILGNLKNEKTIISLKQNIKPKFTKADFENTVFYETLTPIIQNRAVFEIFRVKLIVDNQIIKDKNGEEIYKKTLFSVYNDNEDFIYFMEFESDKKSKKLKEEKDSILNLGFKPTKNNLFTEIFNGFDFENKNYTPKINLKNIEFELFSDFATNVLMQLTNKITENVNGIIQDIDNEFLHDLRVSVRKIHSFLKDTKNYFSKDTMEFCDTFSLILKNTNRLRDSDIFIETNSAFSESLTEYEKYIFNPIIESVKKDRKNEHLHVLNFFQSQFFIDFIDKWKNFVSQPDNYKVIETKEVAKEIVFKNMRRFFDAGEELNPQLNDKQFHKVRIRTKKIRYNLDLFHIFFDFKKTSKTLITLKRFQDYMGVVSDLSFFESFITKYVESEDSKNQIMYKLELKKSEQKKLILSEYSKAMKSVISAYY